MKKLLLLFFVVLVLGIGVGKGQYTVLHNFNGYPTDGANPDGSLLFAGKLYGMTYDGGMDGLGNIFSIDTNGSAYKNLINFNGVNGGNPKGSLIISEGKLFGMTLSCIFSVDTSGNNFKVLHTFQTSTGSLPYGSLTLFGTMLFGMTSEGGSNGDGCIFKLDSNGSNYKDILDFNGTNGKSPYGDLTLVGNRLYGMTYTGGANNFGCIFSIDTNGNYNDLFDFDGNKGGNPAGSLTFSGGLFYGTTEVTLGEHGCIFSIDTNGNSYTVIYNSFLPFAQASLIIHGNVIYGMEIAYSLSFYTPGHIYSINTNGSGFQLLHTFDTASGWAPLGSLTLLGNKLFGMTNIGGINNNGVVFGFEDTSITTEVNEITTTCTVSIFPNPSSGIFTIKMKNEELKMKNIEVYNVLGEKVQTSSLPSPLREGASFTYTMNLTSQPSGVYFYRVLTESGGLVGEGKVVIQK